MNELTNCFLVQNAGGVIQGEVESGEHRRQVGVLVVWRKGSTAGHL